MKMFSRMNFFFDDLRATEGEGEGEGDTQRVVVGVRHAAAPLSLTHALPLSFLRAFPFVSLSLSVCVCVRVFICFGSARGSEILEKARSSIRPCGRAFDQSVYKVGVLSGCVAA